MSVQRSLPAQLVHTVGREVVTGALPSHAVVTAEDLERRFRVSRTVVREAVKVLCSKGLLEARPKSGTVVLDRQRWNLLDADVIGWHHGAESNAALTVDLEEMRSVFEPWAARTAAARRTDQDLAQLQAAYSVMAAGVEAGQPDGASVIEADLRFHRTLLGATHNEFMGRLGQLFEPALRLRNTMTLSHAHDDSFLKLHHAVLGAVADQAPDAAEAAMHELLLTSAHDSAAVAHQGAGPEEPDRVLGSTPSERPEGTMT